MYGADTDLRVLGDVREALDVIVGRLPNAVAGTKCGPHRFESDAVAGTYDENLGHDCPHSYLFSDQY